MSYASFPAWLSYFVSLHEDNLLKNEIKNLSDVPVPTSKAVEEVDDHPFMSKLKATANLTYTDNGALTHKTAENPCLDLDLSLKPGLDRYESILELLVSSYERDPLLTVKIIFQSRSIHQGKGLQDIFYLAYGWLLVNHPQTALANLHLLVDGTIEEGKKKNEQDKESEWTVVGADENEPSTVNPTGATMLKSHGYWKDLLNILAIYARGEQVQPNGQHYKDGHTQTVFRALHEPRDERKSKSERDARWEANREHYNELKKAELNGETELLQKLIEARLAKVKAFEKDYKNQAKEKRNQLRSERHEHVNKLLKTDPVYRALHFTVARMFANQLREDLAQLKYNRAHIEDTHGRYAIAKGISLAAKWAPTLALTHDKQTLIATSIAELLFPPTSPEEKEDGLTRTMYLNDARQRYRKEYLAPLREAMDITERRMTNNQWATIDFSHVPSRCMHINSKHFDKHASEQFQNYLAQVAMGKRSISGATLQPDQLVEVAMRCRLLARNWTINTEIKVANLQWDTLITSLRNAGDGTGSASLGDSLAVCDMSGSMYMVGAINAAIGLSLILAELGRPPFNRSIITFSDHPIIYNAPEKPMSDLVHEMLQLRPGYSTNFEAVFIKLLLPVAVKNKIKQEDMPKRLFVFSDMEFNENSGTQEFKTTWECIEEKYKEAGYVPPHIVWWNLSNCIKNPVTKNTPNCSMISGYSAALLKRFLDGGDLVETTQEKPQNQAISETEPAGLVMDNVKDSVKDSAKESDKSDGTSTHNGPMDSLVKALNHPSYQDITIID